MFDKLILRRKYLEALQLVDTHLTFPAPDYLLTSLAEKHTLSAGKYLVRLKDKKVQ